MNILFIHQNFPGQFKHLAPALASRGHHVVALVMHKTPPEKLNGVTLVGYRPERSSSEKIHPWIADFEAKAIRGEATFLKALELKKEGFTPDVIIAHPGWGESLFLKEVWPHAKLGIYCEFFYLAEGGDVGFDPEFSSDDLTIKCKIKLKNTNNLLHFEFADAAISPTKWQASTFPERFKSKITVVHDGIDTVHIKPNPNVAIKINDGQVFGKKDEIITFVNRNLEPMRGYHIFMRALPALLKARPKAHVLIVGGDHVSYGPKPDSDSWKNIFIKEVRGQIDDDDWKRVHFLGNIPYRQFIGLLQISTVHVYLTYPFVLSWSLLEAMSVGCSIVASDTTPLHEVIENDQTGCLVDFFDSAALTEKIVYLLKNPKERERLGRNAREFASKNYDLENVCLPKQLAWVESLAKFDK